MRTNIDIDDELMAEAMRLSGKKTKKETVAMLVRSRRGAEALRALRGKVEWEGDLDAMRRDK